jgi:hypothetical protein
MTGSDSPWTDLYAPSRQMHHGLGEYVKENVEAARHWVELVAAREVGSVDDIMPGKGALVRLHGKPVAAFRDDVGDLHLHSAVCTHAAASCIGTASSAAGTAPATARSSPPTARC